MTKTQKIAETLEGIVASLGPDDARVRTFERDTDPMRIPRLIHDILAQAEPRQRVVFQALWLTREWPTPEIIADIINIMKTIPEMALLAGDALAFIVRNEDVSAIESIVLDAAMSPRCRAGAALALRTLSSSHALDVLKRGLQMHDKEPLVIQECIASLAWVHLRSGSGDVCEDIVPFLKSANVDVRYAALVALGNVGAVRALEAVEALLEDQSVSTSGMPIRAEAMRVIKLLTEGRS
jgi:HEAT repeat protein